MENQKSVLAKSKIYWVYDKDLSDRYDSSHAILKELIESERIDIVQFRAKEFNYSEYCTWVENLLKLVDILYVF